MTEPEARLKTCQNAAKVHKGKCLSKEYLNSKSKLLWQCKEGHKFRADPDSVMAGHWCPKCRGRLTEEVCREVFKALTGKPWPKSRPRWLVSARGGQMEIDGFCKALGVGFEYQGAQHSEFIPHYHRTPEALQRRMADDSQKRKLCLNHGVKLIEITFEIPIEDLMGYISKVLSEATGKVFLVPKGLDLDSLGFDRGNLEELRKLARSHKGKCLSKTYLGVKAIHQWQCSKDHTFPATPGNIKRSKWCPYCGGHKVWAPGLTQNQARFQECVELAREKNGEFISEAYMGARVLHLWRCQKGHIFPTTPDNVKRKHWCPHCVGLARKSLDQFQVIAKEREGACLSTVYVNSKIKLQFRCKEGHKWAAVPSSISRGTWCRECAIANRKRRNG